MSTVSGFIVGLSAAAALSILYSGKISEGLELAVEQSVPKALLAAKASVDALAAAKPKPKPPEAVHPEPVIKKEPSPTAKPQPGMEQRWEDFSRAADSLEPAGEFPWRACFTRSAASWGVSEVLLLAVASGESNFQSAARSDKDAIGVMQIRWPNTSRHLGVPREADLYDPCTNIDAGARYLAELTARFDQNLHLAIAAYNYGPGRIKPGSVPEGARWYSQYIYQHLQQVLGREHIASSKLIPTGVGVEAGHQTLMRFNRPQRARDFLFYLREELPELDLQQRSEALGQHEVVLIYQSEEERRRALDEINASGVATLELKSNNTLSL